MSRLALCMTIIAAPFRRNTDMEPGTCADINFAARHRRDVFSLVYFHTVHTIPR